MAGNLLAAGFRVVGYDPVAARRRAHARAGGDAAASGAEVGSRARVVLCSLPSVEALLDAARALASSSPRPRIVIETSTLPIEAKERARALLRARGMTLLDCPLSGTGAQARVKDLVVFASGDRGACRRVAPVFAGFSRAHFYVGPFGAGSKMKFVANLLVAIHNVAAAEALVLARKAGLDPAMTLEVVTSGAGNSRMLQMRGPMMVRGRYADATMKLDVWKKDMHVIADFARRVGCPTPLFSTTGPLYAAAIGLGYGAEDTAAVCAVLERRAGIERRGRRVTRR
jgi:3-hydroxyisobutyrate dehydrogenase-like beta-hydroxyacid dehydrogenase